VGYVAFLTLVLVYLWTLEHPEGARVLKDLAEVWPITFLPALLLNKMWTDRRDDPRR
jgi:hypothetical protein